MLGPLLGRLMRGESCFQVSDFLHAKLQDHFGMPPHLVTTAVIDRLFTWWESAK